MFAFKMLNVKYKTSYIVEIQFLGFRFHGWQKQHNVKTVHDMVDKTLSFVFENTKYKTLGVGRTDAKVSANSYWFQLFLDDVIDEDWFLKAYNLNTTQDIRALQIQPVDSGFSIINHSKIKEYHYYFSFGEKNHPYAAPFLVNVLEELSIEEMQKGALLFKGVHYFHKYCTKPSEHTEFCREIVSCEIVENTILTANFFPKKSYVLKVRGKGFLRYQIRLMMHALFELGKGNLDVQYIENSLKEDNDRAHFKNIAPGSGLQLYEVKIEH